MNTSKMPSTSTSAAETQTTSPAETQMRRPSSRRLLWVVIFLGSAGCAVLFVVLLSTVLGKREVYLAQEDHEPFCCPDEAHMVFRVLNSSIDPCDDFYGHVCSRADAGSSEHLSPLFRIIMVWNFIESAGFGTSGSASGTMLASLRSGFWRRGQSPFNGAAQYAAAIVEAGVPDPPLDSFKVVRFLAQLNMRYGLPTVVSFATSHLGTVMNIKTTDCFSEAANETSLPFTLNVVNEALNSSLTISDFLELKHYADSWLRNDRSRDISHSIEASPFLGLPKQSWMDIMKTFVFPVHPNVTIVTAANPKRLNDFVDTLINMTHQRDAIAYIVVCTAFKTMDTVEGASRGHGITPMTISCHALGFCEVEQTFMAEVVSGRRMNGYLRGIFAKLIENVAHDASKHILFNGTTERELMWRLHMLRLVLPEEITVSDIPVPAASDIFAANLLAARSYAFDVKAARVERKIPDTETLFFPTIVRNGYSIFMPTNLYALLNLNVRRNTALDLAVVGVDLATHLWSFLLESSWPNEKRRKIDNRLECFRDRYFNGSDGADYLATATTSLGVLSALDDMASIDWEVVRRVNSTDISLGRLAYFIWAYNKCAALPRTVAPLDMNLAIRNSRSFREAFGCSPQPTADCCLEAC